MNSELQNLFDQATTLQSQGKNTEALGLYKKILENKVTSTSLELNQSLIYEQNKDWGKALRSIDNAQHLSRRPWLASEIKERIERKVISNRAYDTGSISEMLHHTEKVLRAEESLMLSSLLLGAFLILKAIGFKNKFNHWSLGLCLLFLIYACFGFFTHETSYITKESELRAVPLVSAPTKLVVPVGAKVVVSNKTKDFVKVERANDFSGWVPISAIEE